MIQLPFQQQAADSVAPSAGIDWRALLVPDILVRNIGRVILILVVSFVSYQLVRLLVKRIVTHEVDAEDPIVKRLREQRALTLGSLLQNVALVSIVILAGLTILSTFMPIGPLLAGVSVLGLAISFGAQSLVKDIISGTFILLEGQFGIGDVVRVGQTAGQVEKITLRTTMLRDFEGVLHIIPNGEITMVSNLTKNWSRAVLDIRVAYREDVDRVIAVLRQLGTQFGHDREWTPLLLGEPEVLGVQNFTESALLVRMQVRTLPLKQWDVARELRRRIKNRFDAENIEIPFPHLTFYWGEQQSPFAAENNSAVPPTSAHTRSAS